MTALEEDLRRIEERAGGTIVTATASPYNINRLVPIADVLIGAVLIQLEMTPHLLDEEIIRKMKRRSVFLDISIDQGGCSTTSSGSTPWKSSPATSRDSRSRGGRGCRRSASCC